MSSSRHTPHAGDGPLPDELARFLDHRSRPRLSRFWRVAGPITSAQTLFLAIVFSVIFLAAAADGDYILATGSFLLPALAAYLARPILVRNPVATTRAMNTAAAGAIVYSLFLHDPNAPSTSPAAYAVLGYLSFHLSGIYWFLSDASIYPNRKRWWHR